MIRQFQVWKYNNVWFVSNVNDWFHFINIGVAYF